MKKILITCEIVLVIFVLAKIIAIGGIVVKTDMMHQYLSVRPAFAEPSRVNFEDRKIRDVGTDRLLKERELLASLMKRQEELETRERDLQNEKHNLTIMKKEILARIEQLRELEERLTILVESIKEVDERKYQDLARIYESFPPAHAGSMLERLDNETAAAIIMNMKRAKAGAMWEHIKPERALEITKEITDRQLSLGSPREK